MTSHNDDLALVIRSQGRVTDQALRITGLETETWKHMINQFGWTNPGEVGELRQLVDLVTRNGRDYLVELCRQSRLTKKVGG